MYVYMELCKRTKIVSYREFKAFFKNEWAPMILQIHEPRGGTITNFIGDILAQNYRICRHIRYV